MNVSPELLLIRQRIKAMDGDFMRPLNMIQNVSSVRRPDMVIAKLSPDSHFKYSPLLKSPIPNGVGSSTFPKDANLDKFMAVEGGFAFLSLPSTDFTGKFFADVSSGWICAIYGDQAFFQLFKYQPRQYYPDGGCSVEVYVSPYYFELELLSPARTLKPGEEISFDIAWGVTKLKDAKANRLKLAAECEALAATMLNKCHFNGVELK